MKKALIIIACGLLLLPSAFAFELVEAVPLHSTERQEARILSYWLVGEPTHSTLDGYIYHYPLNNSGGGKMEVFYEGHDVLGKYWSLRAKTLFDNAYVSTCPMIGGNCYYFQGSSEEVYLPEYSIYKVSTYGFYNPQSRQIYTRYNHKELGMTWVNFNNHIDIKPSTIRVRR